MLLTHLKIQILELVCISSISILLQCPFQFHHRCNDSKAMAITSISVTRLWLMNVVRIISIKTSSNWSPKLDWNEYWSFSWLTQSVLTMELNMKELISHRDRKGNSEKLYGILSCYYVCAVFLDSKFLIHSTAKCGEYCKQCDRPGKCNKCVRGYTVKHGKCKRKSNILHGYSFSLECYWPTLKFNT